MMPAKNVLPTKRRTAERATGASRGRIEALRQATIIAYVITPAPNPR